MVLLVALFQAVLVFGVFGAPPDGCLSNPPSPACAPILQAVKTALSGEQAHWISDLNDPFYQTPENISFYHPGDLIQLKKPDDEILQKYQASLPSGLIVYRLSYVSADLDNKPVLASAYVLLPYCHPRNSSDAQAFEVIAWGHGSAGISRDCAPSNRNDLYYDYEAPFAMALQGFAVIAADYAGMGTNTTFNYLAGPSHASDMVYSVIAARKALPKVLSEKWVAVGHSEGGLAAWATNEREVDQPTTGFLGAVSIAPSLANLRIIRTNIAKTNGSLGDTMLYPSYTLESIARLNSSVDVSKYYSEVGLERSKLAVTGCYDTAIAAWQNTTFSDAYKDQSWLNSSFADAWESRTGIYGDKKIAKPMLLIEGLSDKAVPSAVVESAFNTLCNTHSDAKVHLSKYPEMDHDAVAYVSQLEYFDWIRGLFDGNGPTKCDSAIMNVTTA